MKPETATLAQGIRLIVGHRPGITQAQLSRAVFGDNAPKSNVQKDCDYLLREGLIEKSEVGGDTGFYKPGST